MADMLLKQLGMDSFFGAPIYGRVVPRDHFLLKLNQVINLNSCTDILLPAYKGLEHEDQPPYPPVVILKMLVIACLHGFSDRQVEEATNLNLAIKGFIRLGDRRADPRS